MKESTSTRMLVAKAAAGLVVTLGILGTSYAQSHGATATAAAPAKKKWTILVYMNGHNNLDEYATKDLNEMEAVGSTNDVNVVVQWASQARDTTDRLLVQKDTDATNVTSPIVESMPRVDMGSHQELIKFLQWAIQKYPAEHYFVDVWNHGNGWVERGLRSGGDFSVNNISYDDISGNSISIPQLSQALQAAATTAGQKIDIYGSDACLMQMAEVGAEIAPAVNYMVGSEDVEPGDGWDYSAILNKIEAAPAATVVDIGKMVVDAYIEQYSTGYTGTLYSLMDLSQMENFSKSVHDFSALLAEKGSSNARLILQAARTAETYETHPDYVDFGGFVANLERSTLNIASDLRFTKVKDAFSKVVVYNKTYRKRGLGFSIWIPPSSYTYTRNSQAYKLLKFHADSMWGDFLGTLYTTAAPGNQVIGGGTTGGTTGGGTAEFSLQ